MFVNEVPRGAWEAGVERQVDSAKARQCAATGPGFSGWNMAGEQDSMNRRWESMAAPVAEQVDVDVDEDSSWEPARLSLSCLCPSFLSSAGRLAGWQAEGGHPAPSTQHAPGPARATETAAAANHSAHTASRASSSERFRVSHPLSTTARSLATPKIHRDPESQMLPWIKHQVTMSANVRICSDSDMKSAASVHPPRSPTFTHFN
ncbi:hypothetical protein JX265_007589 [Neoarthrinium moseri]|uniref:Uncharacterized protein n=1 Tax=Neoarthrinium moseri TaxID=1658444 RepID=A0A9Q0ANG2_9PEZI|nr:hypothetical protein JX265_007589 [Neoarthrinium moseri]